MTSPSTPASPRRPIQLTCGQARSLTRKDNGNDDWLWVHDLPGVARLDDEGQRRRIRARRAGEVIPGIEARRIPGFRSIDLVRRERDHDVEFMTLMWFDTIDPVKAFMGADYETAHVPARAQTVLAGLDRRSAHYKVLDRCEQPL